MTTRSIAKPGKAIFANVWINQLPGAKPIHKSLLQTIVQYSSKYGVCFASLKTLGEKVGCSARTVSRHIETLIEKGWIEVKRVYGSTNRIKPVNYKKIVTGEQENVTKTPPDNDSHSVDKLSRGHDKMSTDKDNTLASQESITPKTQPAVNDKPQQDDATQRLLTSSGAAASVVYIDEKRKAPGDSGVEPAEQPANEQQQPEPAKSVVQQEMEKRAKVVKAGGVDALREALSKSQGVQGMPKPHTEDYKRAVTLDKDPELVEAEREIAHRVAAKKLADIDIDRDEQERLRVERLEKQLKKEAKR